MFAIVFAFPSFSPLLHFLLCNSERFVAKTLGHNSCTSILEIFSLYTTETSWWNPRIWEHSAGSKTAEWGLEPEAPGLPEFCLFHQKLESTLSSFQTDKVH